MLAYTKVSKFIVYMVFFFVFGEQAEEVWLTPNSGFIESFISLESSLAVSLLCINRNHRTVNIPSRRLTTIISYMPHMAELLNQRPSGCRALNTGPGSVSYKSTHCLILSLNDTSDLWSVENDQVRKRRWIIQFPGKPVLVLDQVHPLTVFPSE